MAKIDLKKRQEELEHAGKFAVDMNEQHRTYDALDIEDGYEYLPEKFTERFRRLWLLSVVKVVCPVLTWFAAGTKVVGRRNLRPLKGRGAISVCSHTHTLDTLMVKQALGSFRTFHTGSYYLLKRGWFGKLFKSGGFIPVSMKVKDIRNLQNAVGTLVERGKIVNFYPEHALWPRYEKVRPFQAGAFRYAVKFGAPVVPLFIEYRETALRRFFRMKKKAVVHILPAMEAPEGGTERERAAALSAAVYAAMKAKYEEVYGKPMVYDILPQEETGAAQPASAPAADADKESHTAGKPPARRAVKRAEKRSRRKERGEDGRAQIPASDESVCAENAE